MLKTTQALGNLGGAIQTGMAFSPYFNTKHTDSNTLLSAFGGDETNSMYLGMLKLWNQYQLLSTPLISMTELQNNVIYTNGFGALLNFTIPYKVGLPKIKENLCGDKTKPGIEGAIFPIVLTDNCFTTGDVITYDYRNGKHLIIQPDEVVEYGSGWKYMVKLATMDEMNDYFPPQALVPGVSYMKINNPSGEFDTNTSALTDITRTGLMNFAYKTGNTEMGISHWITGMADLLDVQDLQKNPNTLHISNYANLLSDRGIINFFNSTKDGKLVKNSISWMPSIIMAMQVELAIMKERALMWGRGFVTSGRNSALVASGYYQQIKNRGNYIDYSDFTQLPNILKNIVGALYAGRTDIHPSKRKVKFKMGMGAIQIMQQEFMSKFKQNPFAVFADHPALKGMLSGTYDALEYKPIVVKSYQYPEVGIVDIEHDPSLDFIDIQNEIVPYSGQYPNSSYMVFVEDLTEQDFSDAMPTSGYNVAEGFNNGANVVMIKPKNYVDTMGFEVGMSCNTTLKKFIGWNENSYVHSSKKKGFGVNMFTCGEVYVKDPSRTVLVEYKPNNHFFL